MAVMDEHINPNENLDINRSLCGRKWGRIVLVFFLLIALSGSGYWLYKNYYYKDFTTDTSNLEVELVLKSPPGRTFSIGDNICTLVIVWNSHYMDYCTAGYSAAVYSEVGSSFGIIDMLTGGNNNDCRFRITQKTPIVFEECFNLILRQEDGLLIKAGKGITEDDYLVLPVEIGTNYLIGKWNEMTSNEVKILVESSD